VDVAVAVNVSNWEQKLKGSTLGQTKRRKIRLLKMVDALQRKFVSRIVESSIK